jgi:hypothetical protein
MAFLPSMVLGPYKLKADIERGTKPFTSRRLSEKASDE